MKIVIVDDDILVSSALKTILEAGGEFGADIDVDDGIVVSGKGGEEVGVLYQIGGGGFGHFAAVLGMGEYIGGVDGNAV